ncbi:MAG: DUF1292 domain-containing protein [Limnochordales bacterium]
MRPEVAVGPGAPHLPGEPEEGVEEGAWVFRLDTDDDGEQVLTLVEDDDEWERVRQAWEEQNGAE